MLPRHRCQLGNSSLVQPIYSAQRVVLCGRRRRVSSSIFNLPGDKVRCQRVGDLLVASLEGDLIAQLQVLRP